MRRRPWLRGSLAAVVAVGCAASSCSPGAPPASGVEAAPARKGPSDRNLDEASTDGAPVGADQESRCAAGCTRWLDSARAALDQAKAAGDAPNVELLYHRAGESLIRAWRGCDLYAPTGADLGCEGAHTVVPRMVEAFDRAGRDDGAIFAHLIALDPRWITADTDVAGAAPAALRLLAARAERHAGKTPQAPGAAETLAAAVYARLKLEEPTDALRNATTFRNRYRRQQPDEAALLAVAIAAYHGERGEWQPALAALSPAAAPSGATTAPTRILWHARRGQALAGLGRAGGAVRDLRRALQLWRPPAAGPSAKAVGRAKPAPMQGREQVVDAVGTAYFLLAEQLRAAAAARSMPPYRGKATVKGVNRYVQSQVARWAKEREEMVGEAEREYVRIGQIRPVPPARWVVAAAAATGHMWADFAAAFTHAPPPPPVAEDQELRAAWEAAMTEAAAPAHAKARRAFERCRRAAARVPAAAADAERCRLGLEEHR